MSWLLGIADALRPGAALFVVFDTVLIAGALASFVLVGRRASWPAAPLALACAALPQLLIYPGIVWKDVLFAGSATAGFACLAHAAAGWARLKRRIALLAAAVLLLGLAALARQNGAVVLPFAAGGRGLDRGSARRRQARVRRGLIHALAFLGAAGLIVAGASAALDTRREAGPGPRGQWEILQTDDIVGAVSLEPHTDLAVLGAKAPWLETLLRTDGAAAYTPTRADTLEPVLDKVAGHGGASDHIAAQWKDLIARHPLLYLRVRARAFDWVLLTPDRIADCVPIYTGVDGPRRGDGQSRSCPRRDARDNALADYALRVRLDAGLLPRRLWRPGPGSARRAAAPPPSAGHRRGGHARERHGLRPELRRDLDRLRLPLPLRPRPGGHRRGPLRGRELAPPWSRREFRFDALDAWIRRHTLPMKAREV